MLRLVLTALQCLSASRENPARQHASRRQALKRQYIFTLLSAGNTEAGKQVWKPHKTLCPRFDNSVYIHNVTHTQYTHMNTQKHLMQFSEFENIHSFLHSHTHKHKVYLRTENILAIFPIARILFLITSLRAAAALAAKKDRCCHHKPI